MNLFLASAVFVFAPELVPALAHERQLEPRLEHLATTEVPKSIWKTDTGRAGIHLQSTLVCPARVENFERSLLVPFDNFGFDVGCNLDAQGVGRVTMFLTRRRGATLGDDFAAADAALKQNAPDAQPATGGSLETTLQFTSALYDRADGSRTGLWVADISGWTLKFRATYGSAHEGAVFGAMSTLANQAEATAGAHLRACAAAPAVQRPGTPITDEDKVMELAIITSAFEGILDEKMGPDARFPENWCAEETAGDREAPLLFWQNIDNTSTTGPLDKMSLMTMGEPPALLIGGSPGAQLMDDNDKAPLVHQVTEKRGDMTYVFGFFSGRPSAATLTPLTKDAMLGRKNPIIGFNTKTNEITIFTDKKAKPGS